MANLTISKVEIKGVTFWKVRTPKAGGGATRKFFKDKADAQAYYEQQDVQLENYGLAGAHLDESLRSKAIVAAEILAPVGGDIVDAAKFYAEHLSSKKTGMDIGKAVAAFLKDRDSGDYSPTYRQSLKHRLGHFASEFRGRTTTSITPSEVRSFLRARGSAESQRSYRRNIKSLFSYLKEFHGQSYDPTPAIEKNKSSGKASIHVEILTPSQCKDLLKAATPEVLPSLVMGMFCGLRASEIARLPWSAVDFDEGRVRIDAAVARKVGSRRVVPIPSNAMMWLKPYSKTSGLLQPKDYFGRMESVRVTAGFRPSVSQTHKRIAEERKKKGMPPLSSWPSNGLRHSAISYALASCGNEHEVATWAGNSPAVIKAHYDAQASAKAAKEFFSILPGK
jgi:integrase